MHVAKILFPRTKTLPASRHAFNSSEKKTVSRPRPISLQPCLQPILNAAATDSYTVVHDAVGNRSSLAGVGDRTNAWGASQKEDRVSTARGGL